MLRIGWALAWMGCDELGLTDLLTPSPCPRTGNGRIGYRQWFPDRLEGSTGWSE